MRDRFELDSHVRREIEEEVQAEYADQLREAESRDGPEGVRAVMTVRECVNAVTKQRLDNRLRFGR